MSKLYIVATPIGNLSDITLRAIETLKNVDLILCEDTRVSKHLLDHYQITTSLTSYHQHSGEGKIKSLLEKIKAGANLALITDAGTPGISDPGNKFIAEVVSKIGPVCQIIPIPGPSAIISALSICGLPTDKFLFLGFLPHKKGRETLFKRIKDSEETMVFYESTHRIIKTLERLSELIESDRKIVVSRELTKKFETIYRGNISQVLEQVKKDTIKGEFVVIISGK
ncbi:MAG: 16S rRNA (cytidine(1402)-2'-O)-methyltransferase [Candidatus Buchananbacteria bacterium RIFCSPHIGHO2_02_FULL_40_13]|uniref:Ribosomal RNA small subunit methyltransferase I n=1 Tax=Candidatus Buchananbacteria bacterium RIFCSPLOWO2_01_FULL_39_33 TaxID=1797543 RepID=A0A1G1YKS7_9BACT|nr:MAG: 16S rRNA (cytidine(1402)-2'-O)-methyltransferase [Candidatus Buchananbacteria bacterium RIFCSPHIGHO2_01_FULL_40_35]OGY50875.1 MAG: 16S rRNA (cytidine(1402)-2'-O)-methyltransferase [Candidatus Buchananbacteria bacterium RIFCSPHIGHO2_02_FULL_40_13]OGY52942.1 MAG: 16S rRNA (cytidine(1402)-2'-O)-methyltransferase [Candidatus Buchananbacteria bacterium RIFCSPLOWO2_01_FULL_39_33]